MVLGGAFNCNGNVNPAAEANIFGDPDAADFVFGCPMRCGPTFMCSMAEPGTLRSAAKQEELLASTTGLAVCRTRVVGLDVTHQCFMRAQQIEHLPGQGALGQFLYQISQFYLAYHK